MLVLLTVSYWANELAEQVLSWWVKVNGNGTRFYCPVSGDLSVVYAHMDVHKALTLCF